MDKLIHDRCFIEYGDTKRFEVTDSRRRQLLWKYFGRVGPPDSWASFSNSPSRAWWFPGRSEVVGPSSALFLLAPYPTERPRPFASPQLMNVRPIRPSLFHLSPCFSLARNVIYLFTRFTLTRFSARYHLPVGEIKKLQAFTVHRVECQLVLARSRFLARTVICRIVGIRGLNWGSSRSECNVVEEIAEIVVAVTLCSNLSIRVGRSVE